MRIGQARDRHRLKTGKRLRLGGIDIDSLVESVAHSDGDCLLHAIAEAMLGALALGDLGTHFPDTVNERKGLDSAVIINTANQLIKNAGYQVVNVDTTVHLERPKLASMIGTMRMRVAELLNIPDSRVSIKATTGEGVGPVGTGEAIECDAVVLLERKKGDSDD